MIPDWGATTLFTQGQYKPEGEVLDHLHQRGVSLEESAIVRVVGDGEHIQHVELADGRQTAIQGLYVAPQVTITSPIVAKLKLETVETPMGTHIKVDEFKESSTAGVFVAGDLSNPMQNGTFAIASGTMAGVAAHRALMFNH